MRRAAPAALLAATFGLTFALDPWQDELVSDIPLYATYADFFLDGLLPYRDVAFEYPPLAAPLMALPGLLSVELADYRLLFAGLMLGLALGLLLATARLAELTGGVPRRALVGIALAPLLTGALIRTHFDLAPVLCAVGGLAAVAAGRSRSGFALLGIGGAIKLFPLVAVPVALAWLVGRGRRREAAEGAGVTALVVALAVAAAAALSPGGAWDAVVYHLERPVQIESMPATVLNALDAAGGRAPDPIHSHKSDALEHPLANPLEILFGASLLAALLALTLAAHRLPEPRALALTGLAAIAAFACLGKVLSPQFMVWLLPLMALSWAWGMRALAGCIAAAVAATRLWFPGRYFELVAREEWPLAAVALRNLLLAAVLVLLARELLRLLGEAAAAARSTPPARPGALRSAPR